MDKRMLRKQREKIGKIARQYGARSIKIFGSVARGEGDALSDVDFLVELEPGRSLLDLGGLQMDLEKLLNCHVDVVTPRGLRKRLRKVVLQEAITL